MPKKTRGRLAYNRAARPFDKYNNGSEVFRNASAVSDDTDPHQSLKYLIEIFHGKIDDDVISMVFSECAFNVDQALETLMSLSSDEKVEQPDHYNNSARQLKKSNLPRNFQDKNEESSSLSEQDKLGESISFNNASSNSVLKEFHPESSAETESRCNSVPNSFLLSSLFTPDDLTAQVRSDSPLKYSKNFTQNQYYAQSLPEFISPIFPNVHKHNEKGQIKVKKLSNASKEHFQHNFHSHQTPTQADIDWKKNASRIKHARDLIHSACKVLIIIRGLPGSGKSTLAQKLKFSGVVFSSDDYFSQNGAYNYDPTFLQDAHSWNQIRTKKALSNGITPVIIDNTNTEVWEMAPYVAFAKKLTYQVMILEPNTPWKFKVKELAFRNKHGVPKEKIRNMLLRYQHDVNLQSFNKPLNIPRQKLNQSPIDSLSETGNSSKIGLCNNISERVVQSNNPNSPCSSETPTFEDTIEFKETKGRTQINYKYDSFESIEEDSNQCVSLEAVVHQEETLSDFLPENHEETSDLGLQTMSMCHEFFPSHINDKVLCESFGKKESFGSVGPLPENVTFKNLDDLRSLVQDDSEDSQSLCRDDILKSSDQDLSSWQEITVHDDDFLWKSESEEQNNIAKHTEAGFEKSNSKSFDSNLSSLKENSIRINEQKNERFTPQFNNFHSFNADCLKVIEQPKDTVNILPKNFRKSVSQNSSFDNPAEISELRPFLNSEVPQFNMYGNIQEVKCENKEVLKVENTNVKILNKPNDEVRSSIQSECADGKNLCASKFVLDRPAKSFDESLIYSSNKNNETNLSKLKFFSFPRLELGLEENKNNITTCLKKSDYKNKDLVKSTSDNIKEMTSQTFNNPLWISDDIEDSSWSNVDPQNCDSKDKKLDNFGLGISLKNNLIHGAGINTKKDNCLSEAKAQRNVPKLGLFSSESLKENNTKNKIVDSAYWSEKNNVEDWDTPSRTESFSSDSFNISLDKDDLTKPKPQRHLSKNISLKSLNISTDSLVINDNEEEASDLHDFSNNSDKEQNKKFGRKRSPLIKQNDLSCGKEWLFPQYESSPCDKQNILEQMSISIATHDTQVDPSDFVLLYKIETNTTFSTHYRILTPSLVCHQVDEASGTQNCLENLDFVSHIVKFEKSTNTDDLFEETEVSQKIMNLQECFPDISEEDLSHLLSLCHEDETWLINLLLDSGYKYNNPNSIPINNNNNSVQDILKPKEVLIENSYPEQKTDSNLGHQSNAELNQFLPAISLKNAETPTYENTTPDEARYLPDSNTFEKIQLVLDPAFALQLEEIFGPVLPNGASVDRTVDIDLDFAKLIYDKWKSTVCVKKTTEPSKKIKENKKQSLDEQIKQKICALQKSKDNSMSFSEIMDMEYALQVYKTQKLKKDTDFSTKLKRIELYNMYPGADTIALDEIFESNNYNLKNSVLALGEDLGEPITIRKESEAQNIKERLEEWNKLNVLKEFESDDWSGWVYPEENTNLADEDTDPTPFASTISPHAEGLRKKAAEHYVLRQESIQKAQGAYCRGMKEVASFYAQEGNKHGWKFKELNKEASKLILQERNSTLPPQVLDLHGLHVQEAIPCLESFLKAEKQRKSQSGLTKLSVITGQGLHSVRGPKLRSSVVEFLKSAGYGFAEVNLGVLEVYLKPD